MNSLLFCELFSFVVGAHFCFVRSPLVQPKCDFDRVSKALIKLIEGWRRTQKFYRLWQAMISIQLCNQTKRTHTFFPALCMETIFFPVLIPFFLLLFIWMECSIWFMVQVQVMAIHKFPFDRTFVSKHERIRNQLIYVASIVALYFRCYYLFACLLSPVVKERPMHSIHRTGIEKQLEKWYVCKLFWHENKQIRRWIVELLLQPRHRLRFIQYPNAQSSSKKRWKKKLIIIYWKLKWNAVWNWYTVFKLFQIQIANKCPLWYFIRYI